MKRRYRSKTMMGFFRRKSLAVLLAFLMVFSQVSFSVASPPATTGVANRPGAIKTGKVDMASGNLAFVENIFSLKGYKLTLKYNTEGLSEEVKTINGDKPTGVVGLGWKLSKDRIVRLTHQTANTNDDEYLLNAHGQISKLKFEYEKSGILHFRLPSHPYWIIEFHESNDQWVITKDNGKKYIYGDGSLIAHEAVSTEKGISWGNWIGSSVVPQQQSEFSVAWNLSAIDNIHGERVKLFYTQTTEFVGARHLLENNPRFTKACYLRQVVGMDGNYIDLTYQEKDSDEYEDPHIENTVTSEQRNHGVAGPFTHDGSGDRDAFQERFETKYLSSVTRRSYSNVVDRKVQFSYEFLGENSMKRRILTEIQYMNENNSNYQPSKKFDYYGADRSDNVSVGLTSGQTNVFSSGNGALYGAIKAITIPGGGSYLYKYDQVEIAGSNLTFDIPFPTDVNYSDEAGNHVTTGWLAPKLFFMSDYVVVLHELNAHDRKITNIGVCTWVGDRWMHKDFGRFEGHFYDRYHAEDYHPKNIVSTIKNALMQGLSENLPAIGGLMNAFNDAITDDFTTLYNEANDLAHGQVGQAIEDWFEGNVQIIEDVVEDIFASIRDEIENYEYIIQDILGLDTHQTSEQRLADAEAAYNAQNPRKVYHITMQKDFFAISNSKGEVGDDDNYNQAAYIFEKHPILEGEWGKTALPVRVISKYYDVHSGNEFVAVFDECSDAIFTFTKLGFQEWSQHFYRVNQAVTNEEINNISAITARAQNGILAAFGSNSMDNNDQDYLNMLSVNKRSTIAARNNFIIVATSQADGDTARIQMFHHDKNKQWNWTSPASYTYNKTLIPDDITGPMANISNGLAANSLLQLKAGNSIAALQVYDNLNTEAYNDVMSGLFGGLATTDGSTDPLNPLSSIQSDFVQDLSAMNATYGIVWNEDMSEIDVKLLHVGIGQTGVKTYVNGNVIQKIGKAYSLLIGAEEQFDNGYNYAFRYDGRKFITAKFESDYFTSAMAPDIASQMIESSDKAYKTPTFHQYNANRPVSSGSPSQSRLGNIQVGDDGQVERFTSPEILTNVSSQEPWSLISNASQEQINSPEFVKEAIHVATDLLNLVIQVIMMIIPFAQELAIAEEVISIIDKIVQVVGLAAMVLQPGADALVDKILGVNHKSTSIANNYLSTNGKLFARVPDGSWNSIGSAFTLQGDDKLVGINNELSNGYYPYTVKRENQFRDDQNQMTHLQNYVTILKNRKIYDNIRLNQYVNGHKLVVRKDSVCLTSGSNAFVAYGPANDQGYVVRNEAIVRTQEENAEDRRRKQSFEDATIIRLHRIADEKVTGRLHDYVVKSVETSTGNESTYLHYQYASNTATYHDGHGAAIYPMVTVVPANSAVIPSGFPFGAYRYYFFNSKNYYINSSHNNGRARSTGFVSAAASYTSEPLVEYESFDFRDDDSFTNNGVIPLFGRQYMMEVLDSRSQPISRQIDCHLVIAHDFFHLLDNIVDDHVYQVLSAKKIKQLDGVSTMTVNKYSNEYSATILRTVEHHSTSVTGEPEIHYRTKKYAFEHYPLLLRQNRLHEVSLLVDSVRKGSRTYITDATATAYHPKGPGEDPLWLPRMTYKANLVDDIVNDTIVNYQAVAAMEMALQDRDFADYDALLAAYETKVKNYHLAFLAVVGAIRAAKNSYQQVITNADEIVNAQYEIENTAVDLQESNSELTAAKNELRRLQRTFEHQDSLYKNSCTAVDDAHNKYLHERHIKAGIMVAGYLAGGFIGLGIAAKIENDKIHKDYEAWQNALNTRKALYDIRATALRNVLIATAHLLALNAEHALVVNAIGNAKTSLRNAVDAFDVSYEASSGAVESATEAIHVSSIENLKLTSHSHRVSITEQDTSVFKHRDYITQLGRVSTALRNIKTTVNNLPSNRRSVYSGVITKVDDALGKVSEDRQRHTAHISNVQELKNQHDSILLKVADMKVRADDLERFIGRQYKWYQVKRIVSRDDRTGMPISVADSRDVVTSSLLDANSRFVVATAADADLNSSEAFYSGFESYEKLTEYNVVTTSTNTSVSEFLQRRNSSSTDAHTGSRSLRIQQGDVKLQPRSFNPNPEISYADTAYVVSAYVKNPYGSRVWVGADTLQYENAKAEAKTDPDNRGWQYVEGIVIGSDLRTSKTPTLHISDAWSGVLIDDFSVRPLASGLEATVYNDLSLPIAKIDANGLTKRMYYDSHHRLQTVIDDYGRIYGLNLASFSRENQANDSFDSRSPNEATSFTFIDYGKLERIDQSRLYQGNLNAGTDQAAFSFKIHPDDAERMTLDFTIGNYTINYHNEELHVSHGTAYKVEHLYSGVPEDWTIAQLDDMIYLWVNGKRMDQYHITESDSRNMVLDWNLSGARMGDIVMGKQPVFKVDYTNGIGQHMQTVRPHFNNDGDLIGSIASASLYDGWGHKAVSTLPMFSVDTDMLFNSDLITSFDWNSGVLRGAVSDYYQNNDQIIKHADDHQYPYFRTFYVNYPISRVEKTIKPGHEFHSTIDNSNRMNYQDSESREFLSQFRLSNSDFNSTKKTSSLGHKKIEIKDKLGRKVLSKKGDAISKKVNDFTSSGFMVDSVHAPNHFDTATNPDGNAFVSSHAQKDLLGTVEVNQSPDRGRVELIKDQRGKNIFIKTASSQATPTEVGEIKFYQYDEQERVISQGVYFARWDVDRLNTLAKSPFWYDADLEWVKSFKYDIDDNESALNNKGRITRTLHKAGESFVRSDFKYNAYGQIVANKLSITDKDSELISSSVVQYEYYPSGQIRKITYPNGFELIYSFNRSGKIKSIGTADSLSLFASYRYDELDRLQSQTRDNEVYRSNIAYDFRGRQQITSWQNTSNTNDTIFKQELSFFNAGRYFDTKISRIKYSGSMYTNIQHDYEYDSQDRLMRTNTIMNQNTALSTNSSSTYRYDKNSNLLEYRNTSSPDMTLNYHTGTNQETEGSYNADGLKVHFSSPIWGGNSKIGYHRYTHKPEVIHKGERFDINASIWYKISSQANRRGVISVDSTKIEKAKEGDKIEYYSFVDSDNQYFRFEKCEPNWNSYRIRIKSNEDLTVHYTRERGLYLAPSTGDYNDVFNIDGASSDNEGISSDISFNPFYGFDGQKIKLEGTGSNQELVVSNSALTFENSRFVLLAGDNTAPTDEYVWFNYDAKNNRVMKIRDLTSTDQTLKQDTLIYIHGNNRLPLTEFFYGTSIDSDGNEVKVRNVSNYIYGPDFGSIGIRVFELDPEATTDPFTSEEE